MPPRRALLAALAALWAALVLAAPASAAPEWGDPRAGVRGDALLWATVNVCDTGGYPDGVGIRGSMPGDGDRRDEMFMRIQVQFLRRSAGIWRGIGRSGDSGFIDLGHAGARVRTAGRTFTISPPSAGQPAFFLRGLVTFEWRRDGAVVRRVRRLTSAGHPGTPGADPDGFSAASCSIR